MKLAYIIVPALLTLSLSACGSDAPPVSKGQQLNDLHQAYKSGVIDKDDYKDEREEILDQ